MLVIVLFVILNIHVMKFVTWIEEPVENIGYS